MAQDIRSCCSWVTAFNLQPVTTVTEVTDVTTVTTVTRVTENSKPKFVEWNLRGFPEDLRTICQKIGLDERSKSGKRPKDADIVARLLREALGLPQPQESEVINSAHEGIKKEVRPDSWENAQGGRGKRLRSKAKPAT